jgi:alkylated DNA nucleotide flippase Atl1
VPTATPDNAGTAPRPMPRSPAFARLKRDLLRLVDAIPPGRVTAMDELARAINVPVRHVAYLLATLDEAEQARHPWHRTVGRDGRWTHRHPGGIERLAEEGVGVSGGVVAGWPAIVCTPRADELPLESPQRPASHTRVDGDIALSEARGLGPASIALLGRLGVHTMPQLRAADPIELFGRARAIAPGTSLNLLYALVGAVEGRDWREVARRDRTGLLLELDRRGLAA